MRERRPPAPARDRGPLRREGPEKLTGAALYTDDLPVEGAWYGATVRSTEPHAVLDGIDLDPSFDWTTVVVVTAADIPGENVVSLRADDQPILVAVGGEIKHVAEPVALLAAPDRQTLREAKSRVSLRCRPLPAVLDPLESEIVLATYALGQGDPEAALAAADVVIEGTYRTGHQEQLYIENQAMIALPRDDGVTVHGSLQCPYYVHKALTRGLSLTNEQAVVIQAETGGGFGGKEDYPSVIGLHAALLAHKSRRPVRMIYDRHEDISATTKRHPAIIRHRTGVSSDGTLLAQVIEVILDGGAYTTLTPSVLSRATVHAAGPYYCPDVRITGRAMATNTPPNGAFRGFGATQANFAAEMQVNRAAERLGISPLDLRRRWIYRAGDITPTGQRLKDSIGASEVLETAALEADFERETARSRRQREARLDGARLASGVGLALAWHGAGFTGNGERRINGVLSLELTDDRRVRVLTASTEMGQGTKTIFPQLVADALGIDAALVDLVPQDTSLVPNSGPTVSSRTAMVVGGMLIKAARRLRQEVEAETGLPFSDGRNLAAPRRIDEAFEPYPDVQFDDATYSGDAYPAYGWAACVAKVDVDLDTGAVAVREVVSADDIGRAIHPVMAEGQVEGATLQAVGYATIEEMKLVNGRYLNDRLATYLIPTSLDAPRIRSHLVECPFPGAPHGAKPVGELPIDVPAPAVIAAIHDAIGVWIHDLPASPERVLAALTGGTAPPPPGTSTESAPTGGRTAQ